MSASECCAGFMGSRSLYFFIETMFSLFIFETGSIVCAPLDVQNVHRTGIWQLNSRMNRGVSATARRQMENSCVSATRRIVIRRRWLLGRSAERLVLSERRRSAVSGIRENKHNAALRPGDKFTRLTGDGTASRIISERLTTCRSRITGTHTHARVHRASHLWLRLSVFYPSDSSTDSKIICTFACAAIVRVNFVRFFLSARPLRLRLRL